MKEIHIEEKLKASETQGQGELFSETQSRRKFTAEELVAFYHASFPESSIASIFGRAGRAREALLAKLCTGEPYAKELARCIIYEFGLAAIIQPFVEDKQEEIYGEIANFWENGLDDK